MIERLTVLHTQRSAAARRTALFRSEASKTVIAKAMPWPTRREAERVLVFSGMALGVIGFAPPSRATMLTGAP